jgi:hypothetical protein
MPHFRATWWRWRTTRYPTPPGCRPPAWSSRPTAASTGATAVCRISKTISTPIPPTLRNRIREAGIVGLGGAAFPAAVKLTPRPGQKLDCLVINGAECEPYITCDDMLMRAHARQVIEGVRILMQAVQPRCCLIGIEDHMRRHRGHAPGPGRRRGGRHPHRAHTEPLSGRRARSASSSRCSPAGRCPARVCPRTSAWSARTWVRRPPSTGRWPWANRCSRAS